MITRRQFLAGGGVAGAALLAGIAFLPPDDPLLSRWSASDQPPMPTDGRFADSVYQDLYRMQGVAPLAQAFLAARTNRPSSGQIEAWLVDHLALQQPAQLDTAAFREHLQQGIRADFRAGDLFDLDGWQVSTTEAHLVALRVLYFGAREPEPRGEYHQGKIAKVQGWGPQKTKQGQKVNEQPDGHSGLWFKIDDAPGWVQIEVDGVLCPTYVMADVVTSGLHGKLQQRILSTPGKYPVVLVDKVNRLRQPIGDFVVKPAPGDGPVFCPVTAWGPRHMKPGTPRNLQPDGSIGIWVHTKCNPPGTQVRIDGQALDTHPDPSPGLVTAKLPADAVAHARRANIDLFDPETGQSEPVGTLVVSD